MGVEAKRLGLPGRIGEVVGEVGLPDRDRVELGPGACRHLAGDGPLVVAGPVKGQGEGPDRIAAVRRRQAQHGAGVDSTAEIAADRHIGPEAQADRLVQDVPESLRVLGVGANRSVLVGLRVVKVPVADQPDLPAGGEQKMAGRHLVDALEEGAVLGGHQEVVRLEERGAIPAGGHAGREQRLDLGGQVQRTAVMRVVEGLDAEAITGGEERVVGAVPEGEGELAAQLLQAGRADLFVEMQGDLAVGAGSEAVAPALEVALHTLEVVELAVDDDPHALVFAGDRLIAGRQVDDAEPGMA